MPMLDSATQAQVKTMLEPIETGLELIIYKGSNLIVPGQDQAGHQKETLELLREVVALNPKLSVSERSLLSDDEAKAAGITLTPTIVFREKGSRRSNIRFVGLPAGYEFQTLLQTILMLGSPGDKLSAAGLERVAAIDASVTIQTFVTPGCPYCPRAVLTAFALAYHNDKIVAEGVEASEFPALASRQRISSVPDSIIHGVTTERVLGAQPERVFIEALTKAARPTAAQEAQG